MRLLAALVLLAAGVVHADDKDKDLDKAGVIYARGAALYRADGKGKGEVELAPLSDASIRRLTGELLADETLADLVATRSNGHPYAATTLARFLDGLDVAAGRRDVDLPVEDLVRVRAASLGPHRRRALELLDLTLDDPRLRASPARLREVARAREVVGDYFEGANTYNSTGPSLQRYFDWFAVAARSLKPGA